MSISSSRYLEDLCDKRYWGPSVLFVHETDVAPRNITLAVDPIDHFNIMPCYGVNVFSLLKHETVILSMKSFEILQVCMNGTGSMHARCAKNISQNFFPILLPTLGIPRDSFHHVIDFRSGCFST